MILIPFPHSRIVVTSCVSRNNLPQNQKQIIALTPNQNLFDCGDLVDEVDDSAHDSDPILNNTSLLSGNMNMSHVVNTSAEIEEDLTGFSAADALDGMNTQLLGANSFKRTSQASIILRTLFHTHSTC